VAADRILIVEDEQSIAELVSEALKRYGFRVENAFDGDTGLDMIETTLPDLVILDLMLPGLDGWEICRRMRENETTADIPVMMLTARRDERDVVAGLELGADDYMRKPFSLSELAARVRALLRRRGKRTPEKQTLEAGPLTVDLASEQVSVGGRLIDLSPTEYRLLELLAREEGRVVSREELLAKVWGYYTGDTRTVDVHLWRLRRKIEEDPENPRLIHTLRGRGYRLEWEGETR